MTRLSKKRTEFSRINVVNIIYSFIFPRQNYSDGVAIICVRKEKEQNFLRMHTMMILLQVLLGLVKKQNYMELIKR